jgi:hypothetical protein
MRTDSNPKLSRRVRHGSVSLGGLLGVVAVIRVLRRRTDNWTHGNWSKVASVLAVADIAPALGGYPLPAGADAALWRTHRPHLRWRTK